MSANINKIAKALGEEGLEGPCRWIGLERHVYGYQTLAWMGRLRFHVFHRGDPGEAFHDHPSDFWTFPLRPYVEEVLDIATSKVRRQVVPARQLSWRAAEHAHRVLGLWDGRSLNEPEVMPGRVYTVFWGGRWRRSWQYLLVRRGRVHRLSWRRYLSVAEKHPLKEAA